MPGSIERERPGAPRRDLVLKAGVGLCRKQGIDDDHVGPHRTRPCQARLRAATSSWGFTAAGLAAIAAYFLLPSDGQSVFYVVIGSVSVGAIYVGHARNLRGRAGWPGTSSRSACSARSPATRSSPSTRSPCTGSRRARRLPTPSISAGYPLLALGIFLVLRRLGGQTSRVGDLRHGRDLLRRLARPVGVLRRPPEPRALRRPGWRGSSRWRTPPSTCCCSSASRSSSSARGGRTTAYRLLLASVALWVIADEIYGLADSSYYGGQLDRRALARLVRRLGRRRARIRRWGGSSSRTGERLPRLTRPRLALLAAALLAAPAILLIGGRSPPPRPRVRARRRRAALSQCSSCSGSAVSSARSSARATSSGSRAARPRRRRCSHDPERAARRARPAEGRVRLERLARAAHAADVDLAATSS